MLLLVIILVLSYGLPRGMIWSLCLEKSITIWIKQKYDKYGDIGNGKKAKNTYA